MSIHICFCEDLLLLPEAIKEEPYIHWICPRCEKEFTPPKFSDAGVIGCPHCGHEDHVPEKARVKP